jgi:serine/threonine protein kinase
VRPDGTVKVLDFGLAKAAIGDTASASVTLSPTMTSPALTQMGMILGTAAYMSPEQARGRPADKRSDIWAFGAVLYEMLTGKAAFAGDDVSYTLANILKAEPAWSALPAGTPSTSYARCGAVWKRIQTAALTISRTRGSTSTSKTTPVRRRSCPPSRVC